MKLVKVDLEIRLAATCGGTQATLEHWLVPRMNEFMSFQTVTLCEPGMADVALVWFLTRVYAQMPLQFVCVWAGIRAMGTLREKQEKSCFQNINVDLLFYILSFLNTLVTFFFNCFSIVPVMPFFTS